MSDVSYYRGEAERCRELAAHSPDADMARRWRALAADYDTLADALASSHEHIPLSRAPMQQQPIQQQQSKIEQDDT